MSTCPVCYELFSFSTDSHEARKLAHCSHVICFGCIQSELIDCIFYCPECGTEHKGESVDGISNKAQIAGAIVDVISSTSPITTVGSSVSSDGSGISDGLIVSGRSSLSLRDPCNVDGCSNKSLLNNGGFCLMHSKVLRTSLKLVDSIAKDIAASSTNFDLITQSGSQVLQEAVGVNGDESTPDSLMEKFKLQERITFGEAMDLINKAKDIMFREPNILQLETPVITVGDIHGQFFDLMNIFSEGGPPGSDNVYLFLGDYVDRGCFSCEVMLTLFKLKVRYPDRIWLLRGNHECRSVSGHFGFKEECKVKYGVNVYYRFLLAFQTMPLAAVITTAYGDIFACHGGLSPLWKTLEDIQSLNRFVEPEDDPALLDILWSDPVDDEVDGLSDEEYREFMKVDFRPNPSRGCSHRYGYRAVKDFLDRNRLVCIVRAHEVQEDGYKRHFDPAAMELRMKTMLQQRQAAKAVKETTMENADIDGGLGSSGRSSSSSSSSSRGELRKSLSTSSLSSLVNLNSDLPLVVTIFSAPNYCDRYENKAAILRIEMALSDLQVRVDLLDEL